MAPFAFSSLASVLAMLLAWGGDDAVGNRCQVNCSFTVCTGIGFDAFCEVPVAGDPDIGDAPTICKGCGAIGFKCCDDTAVGEEGSCSSRAGPAICKEVPGEDDPQCVACGREAGTPCCGNDSCDGGLACVEGTCEEELVKIWQQCGGKNYSGPTQCEEGLECDAFNPYYSQCRPEGF